MSSTGTPSISMRSRSRSRVVPGTGVTMATSWPARRFISVLLPALGRPAMTMVRPRVSTRALLARPAALPSGAAHIFQAFTQFAAGEEVDLLLGEIDGGFHVDAQARSSAARVAFTRCGELALQ